MGGSYRDLSVVAILSVVGFNAAEFRRCAAAAVDLSLSALRLCDGYGAEG